MKLVLVTGGFDPLHNGHLEYFKEAKKLGDKLIVGVNSDAWLTRKKGKPFLPSWERIKIIENLRMVDQVITFNDDDNTAKQAIWTVKNMYPQKHTLIFANGGDRTSQNIPESEVEGVEFVYGVGGSEKLNSSSTILEDWRNTKTERPWGWYKVLDDKLTVKVKELVIMPNQSLSYQKHKFRNEFWYVLKGECSIETEFNNDIITIDKKQHQTYDIGANVWHRAYNKSNKPCHILEVQHGSKCVEDDIERKQ